MAYLLLGLIVVAALLAALIAVLAKTNPAALRRLLALLFQRAPADAPYRKKEYLLSKAENSFYQVLRRSVEGQYAVFPKVRLVDILYVAKDAEGGQSHRNRIMQKHVDFLLCDLTKVSPVLAIELDDRSHGSASRQARDAFVEQAFASAGLPLLRVPANRGYSPQQLAAHVQQAIAGAESRRA
jgi:hypothetical protein